jgi:predicted NUDIX family phosphoesterase
MEFVFVAPREALFPACLPQGFQRFRTHEEGAEFLGRLAEHGFFVERARAERTPQWKQPIPYCVIASDERILLLKRRAKGGEARLHDKLSIGVGGHVNPVDRAEGGEAELLWSAARRELAEELDVRSECDLRLVGFLNDDSNPVGAVHVGLVFTARTSGAVHIREKDVLEGALVDGEELLALAARGGNLETWSRILIAHLDELGLVRHHATHRIAT